MKNKRNYSARDDKPDRGENCQVFKQNALKNKIIYVRNLRV